LSFFSQNYAKNVNGLVSCSETYVLFNKYCDKKGLRTQNYKEFITSLNFNSIETERKNCYKTPDGLELDFDTAKFKNGYEITRVKHNFIVGYKPRESDESDESALSTHSPL